MTDAASHLVEQATYCRPNDEKRPSLVGLPDFTTQQVCPEELSETVPEVDTAYPDGWYVRIMFDELLDPAVETLTEVIDPDTGEPTDTYIGSIATTKPVKLECESVNGGMVNVDYDGYYSPSGNKITWPVGPSLVIKPNDPTLVATNTTCQVTINATVVDKGGEAVADAQRGPYKFKVAPITVLAVSPEDDPDGEAPVTGTSIWYDNVYVQFNTTIDQSSLCASPTDCDFTFTSELGYCYEGASTTVERIVDGAFVPCHVGGTACPTAGDTCRGQMPYFYDQVAGGLTDAELFFGPTPPVQTETDYTFEFKAGSTIADRCGKETTFGAPDAADGLQIHFTVDKFDIDRANIATGETSSPLKKLKLSFTNIPKGGDNGGGTPLPNTTLSTNGWTITPPLFDDDGTTALTNADMQVVADDFSGQVFIQGNYKVDTEYTFTLKAGTVVTDAWGATYTQAQDMVVKWKTQPKIVLTSTIPADKGEVELDATGPEFIALAFNQAMDPATLDAADFTVTDSAGAAVAMDGVGVLLGCDKLSTSCYLGIVKVDMPAGSYKFTLKKDAQLADIFGTTYTQAADKVINFTVKAPTTTPPIQCL